MSNIVRLEESIDACVEMLVATFRERAAAGGAVDMAEWVQWYDSGLRDSCLTWADESCLGRIGMLSMPSNNFSSAACSVSWHMCTMREATFAASAG